MRAFHEEVILCNWVRTIEELLAHFLVQDTNRVVYLSEISALSESMNHVFHRQLKPLKTCCFYVDRGC